MPITVQKEPLCRTSFPDELAEQLAIAPDKRAAIGCTLELEHRGACICVIETATHIVQLAWWKHNYPPAQPDHLPLAEPPPPGEVVDARSTNQVTPRPRDPNVPWWRASS